MPLQAGRLVGAKADVLLKLYVFVLSCSFSLKVYMSNFQ